MSLTRLRLILCNACGSIAIVLGVATLAVSDDARIPDKPITAEERDHWAFQPPKRSAPPVVNERNWVRNPIDAFIAETLKANRLSPAPEADRTTLLRRLSFDLTGLPPSPDEIESFLNDRAVDAYETVVDRLLASPQYGVRWAQHWLDLARYADTDGFEFDQARPNAWRYRDWVVDALNRDLPYDQFVRFQLAGDEVAPDDPAAFVATGFNRCYPDMVDLNDQGLRRQNALNDITETTGLVFLGLTVGCARCHDHKFDPIRQADFYRLQAFFTPARFRDDYPIATADRRKAQERAMAAWRADVAKFQAAILRIEKPIRDRLAPGLPMGSLDDAVAAYNKPEAERSPAEVSMVYEILSRDGRIKAKDWPGLLDKAALADRQEWLARLERSKKAAPPPLPTARGIDESGRKAPPTYFLKRGEYTSRGPAVDPSFPSVLATSAPSIPTTAETTGRRRALADGLTRPDHPLTARVMVNRLWQGHFGRGLVGTSSDFGVMGDEPSHPELLDWLATEFVVRGWSLKAMHRLIVTSATYRQSSRPSAAQADDPENRLLARQNRRRLDGEAIRDAMLSASGRLNPALGGPAVFPPLPPELTKLSSKGAIWPVSAKVADQNRRSLYIFVRRNLRFPFFEAFDRPDTNASCPKRPVTTIAPQALSLLNSPLSSEAAHALAARAELEAGTSLDARIEHAYLITLGRRPDEAERSLARDYLSAPGSSFADFCLALLNLNEFVYVD
ncbi:MAG: DUF1549 and DUF1553 domain-containing protein [Isosphaeraceae bacterium]